MDDTQRIDWLESYVDHWHNIDRITAVLGKFNGLPTLRAAIDAASAPVDGELRATDEPTSQIP